MKGIILRAIFLPFVHPFLVLFILSSSSLIEYQNIFQSVAAVTKNFGFFQAFYSYVLIHLLRDAVDVTFLTIFGTIDETLNDRLTHIQDLSEREERANEKKEVKDVEKKKKEAKDVEKRVEGSSKKNGKYRDSEQNTPKRNDSPNISELEKERRRQRRVIERVKIGLMFLKTFLLSSSSHFFFVVLARHLVDGENGEEVRFLYDPCAYSVQFADNSLKVSPFLIDYLYSGTSFILTLLTRRLLLLFFPNMSHSIDFVTLLILPFALAASARVIAEGPSEEVCQTTNGEKYFCDTS
jgi:Skp family chaperone for outer membrane proteins